MITFVSNDINGFISILKHHIKKNKNKKTKILVINTSTIPSLYSALRSLRNGVLDAPHVGTFKLLHEPLKVLYLEFGLQITTGAHLLM